MEAVSVVDAEPATSAVEKAFELNAFDYVPDWSSRILGLGGPMPAPDPNYAFHTPYTDFGDSPALVSVQFEGLQATHGIIVIRIGALPRRQGAMAFQVAAQEFPIWVMAKDGEPMRIRFRPSPDNLYAVMGHIFNDTDAAATGVAISVRRASEVTAEAEALANQRRTLFGAPSVRPAAQLTTVERPTLAYPVSQMPTADQYREAAYAEWSARLGESSPRDPEQWRQIYILQVLRRYGLLEPGARGLCLGSEAGGLPAILAETGCSIVMTDPAAEGIGAWRRPALCPTDLFDLRVTHEPANLADIPPALASFDFLWSQPDPRTIASLPATTDFLVRSMACLKPAGLAVHIVAYQPRSAGEPTAADGTPLFRPGDFERLALTLIGQGHEVAQINYDDSGDPEVKPFGFIVRRGLYT